MALAFLHYDVFTTDPLSGNQLAVFLDGRGVATERMQALAREMNFSESTFILPAEAPGTDVRMRIFTPGNELPMAGHPTIGSTFALAHAGVIEPGAARFVFGLGVGPTPVDLEWSPSTSLGASPSTSLGASPSTSLGASPSTSLGAGGLTFAWMTQLNPTIDPPIADRAGTAASLSLTADDLVPDLPVQQIHCGLPYILVPFRDRETVDRAEVDAAAFRAFASTNRMNRDACFFLFSASPSDPAQAAYARMFAPAFGIPEDPATGSACGPLACYLVHHRLITGAATRRIVIRQGVKMGRPSTIYAAVAESGGTITEVKVGGQAVLVGRGEILA
ncbi:MAG: PhzF family phenazine biosynthesis protein [Acidimicrobiia bacterium]|nr:PhzF family phenazine biosynthesis protein [Acidimicrobiia bacterium]